MTESFAELFEQSQTQLAKLKPGAIVTGVVVLVAAWGNVLDLYTTVPGWDLLLHFAGTVC